MHTKNKFALLLLVNSFCIYGGKNKKVVLPAKNTTKNIEIKKIETDEAKNNLIAKPIYFGAIQYFVTYNQSIENQIYEIAKKNTELIKYSVHKLDQGYILLILGESPITRQDEGRVIEFDFENEKIVLKKGDPNKDHERFWKLFFENPTFGRLIASTQNAITNFQSIEWTDNKYPSHLTEVLKSLEAKVISEKNKNPSLELNSKNFNGLIKIKANKSQNKTLISSISFNTVKGYDFEIKTSKPIFDKIMNLIPKKQEEKKSIKLNSNIAIAEDSSQDSSNSISKSNSFFDPFSSKLLFSK